MYNPILSGLSIARCIYGAICGIHYSTKKLVPVHVLLCDEWRFNQSTSSSCTLVTGLSRDNAMKLAVSSVTRETVPKLPRARKRVTWTSRVNPRSRGCRWFLLRRERRYLGERWDRFPRGSRVIMFSALSKTSRGDPLRRTRVICCQENIVMNL